MCQQGPDLSHVAPAFLCVHHPGHHLRLHGNALYGSPADLASQFQYPPKASYTGTPETCVTISSSLDLDTLLTDVTASSVFQGKAMHPGKVVMPMCTGFSGL